MGILQVLRLKFRMFRILKIFNFHPRKHDRSFNIFSLDSFSMQTIMKIVLNYCCINDVSLPYEVKVYFGNLFACCMSCIARDLM